MCLVDLNRTTQSCGHRWYHLLSPCATGAHLTNCPGRLALEGWEIKCDFCPFCAGWDLSNNEFLVLGGSARNGSMSSAASTSSGGFGDNDAKFRGTPIGIPLSRQPSMTASVSGARRISRSGSFAGSEISISPYDAGPVLGALEKNQQMNARIHGYIEELPELASLTRKPTKSKFRKPSRSIERVQAEQINEEQSNSSTAWKRRSQSIISLVRRR
jgi:hypothetical protein